jgi:hypothetical protein
MCCLYTISFITMRVGGPEMSQLSQHYGFHMMDQTALEGRSELWPNLLFWEAER